MVSRYATLLILVAMLVAGFRVVRVATMSESGWGLIVTQWQDAALGPVGLGHQSIGHFAPAEQARFWLAEVERVVHEHPTSASVHMGAAWVLDSPDVGFLEDHFRQSAIARTFPQRGLEIDEDAITEAKTKFRDQCIDSCLEMAKRATQLEPTDVRWWRMRALLLFEGDTIYSGQEFEQRDTNWLEILDECRKHDPDNGLYDYLAALQLWNDSASFEWPDETKGEAANDDWIDSTYEKETEAEPPEDTLEHNEYWILAIRDADGFELGLQRFLEAQEKPFVAIGEAGYSSIAEFLAKSRLRKADQAEVAISRLVIFRHSTLFTELWRWQSVRADTARTTNDQEQESTILRQILRFYDQVIYPEEIPALNALTTFGTLRQYAYWGLDKLYQSGLNAIDSEQIDTIRQREEELRIETVTLLSAMELLEPETDSEKYSASWPAVFAVVISKSSATLLFVAGVFLLMAKLLSRRIDGEVVFGLLRHAIAWTVGCGGTFLILGMAPAEMVSHEVQRIAIIVGIWTSAICITAAVVWFAIRILRLRRFRFRLITLFAVTTGAAVLSSLWPLMDASFNRIAQNPPEMWVHAKGWAGIDAEVLRIAMKLGKGTWYWAMMQWFYHRGLEMGLAVSLVLASVWFMWRSARKANQTFLNYLTQEIKSRWAALFSFTGRSAFAAAMCCVFLYLCVAPQAVLLAEAEFQHQMRYCRSPLARWTEIRNAQAAVVASDDKMKEIREDVHFKLFGEGVLERDFSQD